VQEEISGTVNSVFWRVNVDHAAAPGV